MVEGLSHLEWVKSLVLQLTVPGFEVAFEQRDLSAFVKLMGSTQRIENFEERMHPWAKDPATVGALAGSRPSSAWPPRAG